MVLVAEIRPRGCPSGRPGGGERAGLRGGRSRAKPRILPASRLVPGPAARARAGGDTCPMPMRRPSLHTETLVLACALYLLLACNAPFWRAALAGREWGSPGTWALAAAMFTSFT